MRPFYSSDDRLIVPTVHIVSFVGKNNSAKGKTLIYLLHRQGLYFTAKQLHEETGVDYNYLKSRLSFWWKIRYLNRKALTPAGGRPAWAYAIAERGVNFVTVRMPQDKRNEYVTAINQWRTDNAKQ